MYTIWTGFGYPCSCLVLWGSGSRPLQQPTTTSVRLLGRPCSRMALQVQQPSISSEGLGLGSCSRVRLGRQIEGRLQRCTTISAGLGSPSWTVRLRRPVCRYMARCRVANSICCLHRRRSTTRTRELWQVAIRRQRAEEGCLLMVARVAARLSRRRVLPPQQVTRCERSRPAEHSRWPHGTVERPRGSRSLYGAAR